MQEDMQMGVAYVGWLKQETRYERVKDVIMVDMKGVKEEITCNHSHMMVKATRQGSGRLLKVVTIYIGLNITPCRQESVSVRWLDGNLIEWCESKKQITVSGSECVKEYWKGKPMMFNRGGFHNADVYSLKIYVVLHHKTKGKLSFLTNSWLAIQYTCLQYEHKAL